MYAIVVGCDWMKNRGRTRQKMEERQMRRRQGDDVEREIGIDKGGCREKGFP